MSVERRGWAILQSHLEPGLAQGKEPTLPQEALKPRFETIVAKVQFCSTAGCLFKTRKICAVCVFNLVETCEDVVEHVSFVFVFDFSIWGFIIWWHAILNTACLLVFVFILCLKYGCVGKWQWLCEQTQEFEMWDPLLECHTDSRLSQDKSQDQLSNCGRHCFWRMKS